ncbi:hypothetical protein ACM66B_000330 [Microbotryomycetes sp. NB124-2]
MVQALLRLVAVRVWLMERGLTLGPLFAHAGILVAVMMPCWTSQTTWRSLSAVGRIDVVVALACWIHSSMSNKVVTFLADDSHVVIAIMLLLLLDSINGVGTRASRASTPDSNSSTNSVLKHAAAVSVAILLVLISPPLSQTQGTVKVLDARQGITGRIITAETVSRGMRFRYLRSDHSLLGGLWVGPAEDEAREAYHGQASENEIKKLALQNAESIYSTFVLQEAATLIERARPRQENALVIGVGAGLIVRSLEARRINVTAVEIDPVVYEHARNYFGLGEVSGGVHLEDARAFLSRGPSGTYDYVIHDVFTGGELPASLFTKECWGAIKSSLSFDGVVAINFAGDTSSASARSIFATIADAFSHCRAFEDGEHATDYRNLVIFCSDAQPITFRAPAAGDFISTVSPRLRQRVFSRFERKEIELNFTTSDRHVTDANAESVASSMRPDVMQHWSLMHAHYHSGSRPPVWPGSLGGWTLAALSSFIIALFASSLFLVGILTQQFWSSFWLNLAVWFPLFILFLITAIGIDVANDNNTSNREGMFATTEAFVWMVGAFILVYHGVFAFHAWKHRNAT